MGERGDQSGRVRRTQSHGRGLLEAVGHQPVDAPAIIARVEVEVALDGLGDRPRVLDDLAIHVEDVKRPIGGVGELDGPEPCVLRRDEFHARLVRRTRRDRLDPRHVDLFVVNEVSSGIADERVADELRGEGVAPVDRPPRRTGEIAGRAAASFHHARHLAGDAPMGADDAPRLLGAEPEDFGSGPVDGDVHQRGHRLEKGVPPRVAFLKDVGHEMPAVARGEAASGVVEAHAVLAAAGGGLHHQGLWIEDEVPAAKVDLVGERARRRRDPASVRAGRSMDAIVEAPEKTVGQGLHVQAGHARAEAGEDHLALIGPAIAVRVAEPEDVGRGRDEDAAARTDDGRGPREAFGVDGGFVEPSVAVGVLEQADASQLFVAAFGVVPHLDDEHPAVLVEGGGDRIAHEGFGRDEFQLEAGLHLEGAQRVGGLDGGKTGKVVGGNFGS